AGLAGSDAADLDAALPVGAGGHDVAEYLRYLVAGGRAVAVTPDYHVHADALAGLRSSLRVYFRDEGNFKFADFRGLTGLSRKLGIPMLEYLDANKLTRRVGDLRVAGPALSEDT
ncbi:SelB C-terminal domain-containing protein, partial [bacterium]|nr:SelB C-terminal domain-containing protein [bacterium]